MNLKDRQHLPALAWFILFFTVAVVALFTMRGINYYPQISMATSDGISVNFLLRARDNSQSCQAAIQSMSSIVKSTCPTCTINTTQCSTHLTQQQEQLLSDQPISQPSAHIPDGVIAYAAPKADDALAACMESQRKAPSNIRIKCYAPDEKREFLPPQKNWVDPQNIGYAFLILIFAQLVSKLVCFLIIRYEHLHAHFSHDTSSGPQKFHAMPTPRIGGVAIIMGLLVSSAVLTVIPQQFPDKEFGFLLLASTPAFLGGLTEDITKTVGVVQRLLLTMISGAFGAWLLGATLNRLDIPGIDTIMQWAPLAIAFTIFAVAGVTNAINIIDGYNGLAAGYSIIVLAAMAFVSAQVGDTFLLTANLAMVGSLLGFLVWNWPSGKIFLGDGGAYLLGFWLSEMAVLIVARHPEVSVWFPMLLMIYPVFETIFSIYRKKILRNHSPGHPDGLHFHMLIYKRLVRRYAFTTNQKLKMKRNSLVCWYVWAFTLPTAALGVLAWNKPIILISGTITFCIFYVYMYRSIILRRVAHFIKMT